MDTDSQIIRIGHAGLCNKKLRSGEENGLRSMAIPHIGSRLARETKKFFTHNSKTIPSPSQNLQAISFTPGYPTLQPVMRGLNKIYLMATSNLQHYELMVIFTPVLAEDDFRNALQKFQDVITGNAGEIVHSNPWGLRPLAYPINKMTTGLYWVLEYQATTDTNAKLELQMNRDENVIRHMITRLDKYAVDYNARKRNRNYAANDDANPNTVSSLTPEMES